MELLLSLKLGVVFKDCVFDSLLDGFVNYGRKGISIYKKVISRNKTHFEKLLEQLANYIFMLCYTKNRSTLAFTMPAFYCAVVDIW